MSQASPTAATRATSSPSGASGAAATPQHRRSRLPGRLQARRVLDLAAREKSARIGIGTALLDALACTALFFAAGAAAESAFLHQQDAPRYEWDTSLLDVIVVAAVRAAVSAACWRLASAFFLRGARDGKRQDRTGRRIARQRCFYVDNAVAETVSGLQYLKCT